MNFTICKLFAIVVVCISAFADYTRCDNDTAKFDKSSLSSPFGALSKKFGDENVIVSLVKSLADFASSGFKTGLEASVRSIFKKPVTTAVYALSMLVGVVAMLAFYESPISPLPVPALPDPPVGRFPPEHPVWPPPGNQMPNRHMQYNQRRTGSAPMFPQMMTSPGMINPAFHQYVSGDHHRSDKTGLALPIRTKPHVPMPNQMNETSYNNYISKLTLGHDLNNNNNDNNGNKGKPIQTLDSLNKHMYDRNPHGVSSDVSNNKVIDYSNKRMAVESLKYINTNQTQQQTS